MVSQSPEYDILLFLVEFEKITDQGKGYIFLAVEHSYTVFQIDRHQFPAAIRLVVWHYGTFMLLRLRRLSTFIKKDLKSKKRKYQTITFDC